MEIRALLLEAQRDFRLLSTQLLNRLSQWEKKQNKIKKDNTAESNSNSIQVVARIRPANTISNNNSATTTAVFLPAIVALSDQILLVQDKKLKLSKEFKFSSIGFNTQNQMYDAVKSRVKSAISGHNACIFAYGQTGSGKSFSMSGSNNNEQKGIYQHAITDIFEAKASSPSYLSWRIVMSMVEIYNDEVMDLFNERKVIEVRQQLKAGEPAVHLKGVCEHVVESEKDAISFLSLGEASRVTRATKMNHNSSRSHSLVMFDIYASQGQTSIKSHGRLVLVDLAGSERVSKTDATGDRLTEARHINRSLSALGDVMLALQAKHSHVPYRNSKLTHLLQGALDSNSAVTMLVHVNPSPTEVRESLYSLRFASRVRKIELGELDKSDTVDFMMLRNKMEEAKKMLEKATENLTRERTKSSVIRKQLDAEVERLQKLQCCENVEPQVENIVPEEVNPVVKRRRVSNNPAATTT